MPTTPSLDYLFNVIYTEPELDFEIVPRGETTPFPFDIYTTGLFPDLSFTTESDLLAINPDTTPDPNLTKPAVTTLMKTRKEVTRNKSKNDSMKTVSIVEILMLIYVKKYVIYVNICNLYKTYVFYVNICKAYVTNVEI